MLIPKEGYAYITVMEIFDKISLNNTRSKKCGILLTNRVGLWLTLPNYFLLI